MIEFYNKEYTKKLAKTKLEESAGFPAKMMAGKIDAVVDKLYEQGFRIVKADEKSVDYIESVAGKKLTCGDKA